MAGKSDYLTQQILNHLFRGTGIFAAPANTFIGLYTAAPTDAGGGTECAYGGYARVPVASIAGNWKDPGIATVNRVENLVDVVFPVNNGPSPETVVALGVFDALAGGNLLFWNTITNFTIERQMQPIIDVNTLIIADD